MFFQDACSICNPLKYQKNVGKTMAFHVFPKIVHFKRIRTNTTTYQKTCKKRGVANNTPEKLPKTLLRQSHNLPKSPKMPKDVPKMTPRPLEVAPRGLQKAAKRPQDVAKTPSRWPQGAQTLLQGAPRPTQDPPKDSKNDGLSSDFQSVCLQVLE